MIPQSIQSNEPILKHLPNFLTRLMWGDKVGDWIDPVFKGKNESGAYDQPRKDLIRNLLKDPNYKPIKKYEK